MSEILRLENISKTFPGVKALQDISFSLNRGEVHCLCGENGAGKSTLIKILSGAYQPDEGGKIFFDGKEVVLTPHTAIKMGIQTIYQEHITFNTRSIVENIFAGAEITKRGILQKKEMWKQTEAILKYLKSDLSPDARVSDITSGEKKIVEIAKGLVFKSNVIILDEPTASFSSQEIDTLLEIIRTLKNDGIGVIYISHHLEEVFKIGDVVSVLRDGRKISMYPIANLTKNMLIKDMVGRDPSTFYVREKVPVGDVVLSVRNLTGNGVRNVSFDLHQGEILGIAGMAGSGRSELMNVLFGSAKLDYGEIRIRGSVVKHSSPKDAIQNKMCFITEDRQNTGLFLPQSVAENVIVANLINTKGFVVKPSQTHASGQKFIELLNIKTRDAQTRVVNLSGGNQQKVVLGKWFNTGGEIFIFDEPSHGIDVGSKQEIYQVMVDLLKKGMAILMVSSDMPEVISMSDRVIVLKSGEQVGQLVGNEITEENILTYSIGDTV
ncbi:sugar ABC transporter ATP-binding protein [Sphaerochaeta sp. PS]|uniref:sugar ABC transporter ATP-binding protein n=1 Tax=Sphaerochaeta sp. PS TaxID=3076336 RepID=UPI0028A39BF9|nr:sugar ABC transporter ATP-binding protein [Sphaerochaeta sp. PS]MDT4761129.1 sugar ABC transporter ATP-binding protein [Sphaerochaeta sp. PS]